jgi:ketosteroid isomerase-like protein
MAHRPLEAPKPGHAEPGEIFRALQDAIAARDADAIAALYAEDAEIEVINRNHPPGKSMIVKGREAILRLYGDLLKVEAVHQSAKTVISDSGFAFEERCRFPDNTRVAGNCIAEIRGGKIWRQSNVDVWDE